MEDDIPVSTRQTAPLLGNEEGQRLSRRESGSFKWRPQEFYLPAGRVLPLSLLAALAMSSTAATAYFAYATLICKDPSHCEGDETTKFAGSIAATTAVANVLGMVALGPLQRLSRARLKLGLLLWIMVRSMSVVMLILGVELRSIYVALCNRVFEGLASDNLLHFALNMAYAQHPMPEKASYFIGYSLALYMVGISTSPFVTGLLKDFTISFVVALGLFVSAAGYLQLCVRPQRAKEKYPTGDSVQEGQGEIPEGVPNHSQRSIKSLKILVEPLRTLGRHRSSLLYGLSLLAYNLVQSYMFNALLVHTSLKFGFRGKQNGLLISIVHSIGAIYIFTTLFLIPRIAKTLSSSYRESALSSQRMNKFLAPLSLIFQSASLLALGLASDAWQVYVAASLLALGLPTPSFIKAHVIGDFDGSAKSEALAALAMMETAGDVLGPLVLGGWQSYSALGGGVFFLASGMVIISLILFLYGLLVAHRAAIKLTEV